jgi:hypothetical protein
VPPWTSLEKSRRRCGKDGLMPDGAMAAGCGQETYTRNDAHRSCTRHRSDPRETLKETPRQRCERGLNRLLPRRNSAAATGSSRQRVELPLPYEGRHTSREPTGARCAPLRSLCAQWHRRRELCQHHAVEPMWEAARGVLGMTCRIRGWGRFRLPRSEVHARVHVRRLGPGAQPHDA